MASYPGIYRAKAVTVDTTKLSAFVPQVFGDVPVTVENFVGAVPTQAQMGWVSFQGGSPEFPVWHGAGVASGNGGGGTVSDVVWIGDDAPTDTSMELWYDTDEVAQFATMNDHWNTAWGVVAQFPRLAGPGIAIGTMSAITGNLSWTFQNGRRYRVVCILRAIGWTTPAATFQAQLWNGAAQIAGTSNFHSWVAGNYGDITAEWFIDGTGQSYATMHFRASGVGMTAYVDAPSQFYVEDIGPITRLASDSPPPAGFDWTSYDSRYADKTATEAGLVVDSAPLSFAAGFEDYLTNYGPCKVTKFGPIVVCQGLVKRSIGQTTFTSGTFATVPVGFRPTSGNQLFVSMATSAWCRIDVNYTTGVISLYTTPAVSVAAGAWIGINCSWVVT